MKGITIVPTKHYERFHEKEIPWDQVIRIIFTAKRKRKGKNMFEFKSDNFYVLCSKESNTLKVINAKRK